MHKAAYCAQFAYLLQRSSNVFNFTTKDVWQGYASTAPVDDLIAELAQQTDQALWCIVEAAQAPDHANAVQDHRQNLGYVLHASCNQDQIWFGAYVPRHPEHHCQNLQN